MGAVYQAKDLKRQGTVCAIKEMSLSMVPPAEQAQAIQNFKIEAKMLWGLDHPNLPVLTGFFSQNQRYFLVMEYINGLTLEELLERNKGPFPERRVLGWARQLCDVLEYLHSQNPPIIFRDMKPGNIMLARNGQIKLIDFGIARFFRPTNATDTQLLGTPGFAPPEQYGRAQTDERSDIYALGITLFQLLTDELAEGDDFGLPDVRRYNPQISTSVARALEKATAVETRERYESVAAFRRALLGEGNFVFESGEAASTVDEFAELCAHYPEEAADYLAAGEIELWLHEIGEEDLSQMARRIQATVQEPFESINQLLRIMASKHPRVRPYAFDAINVGARGEPRDTIRVHEESTSRSPSKRITSLQVSPRTLDFGQVHPGVPTTLVITISGNHGQPVQGTIETTETWIHIDRTQFDGPSTYVNVRVNSMQFHRYVGPVSGKIIISPDDENLPEVIVKVEAEMLDYLMNGARRAKTNVPDMDEPDDDDDDIITPIPATGSRRNVKGGKKPFPNQGRKQIYTNTKKYRTEIGTNSILSSSWEPNPVTPKQLYRQRQGLAFIAAFMLSSLLYTLFGHQTHSPLLPDPRFIIILAGMVPVAPMGALLIQRTSTWDITEIINRAVTGMICVLATLALARLIWQFILPPLGVVQLCVMLILAALSATVGTDTWANGYIIDKIDWALLRLPLVVKIATVCVGLVAGYLLSIGIVPGGFTLFGMLIGVASASALVWRVDYLLGANHP